MIQRDQLARLAELYDQYQNSIDPLAQKRLEAGLAFKELLGNLHAAHAPDIEFDEFRREAVSRCREFLRKNKAP